MPPGDSTIAGPSGCADRADRRLCRPTLFVQSTTSGRTKSFAAPDRVAMAAAYAPTSLTPAVDPFRDDPESPASESSMSAKRTAGSSPRAAGSSGPAVTNAILVAAALAWGVALLVQRGRMTWPPYSLLSSLATLAGCLALVGPFIFFRSSEIQGSLGELAWMTAG